MTPWTVARQLLCPRNSPGKNTGCCSVSQLCLTLCDPMNQHTRPPCPSPTPGVHQNPCPLCQWCHPTISSSVIPFSSCPQSFPASGSFPMSQLCIRWPKYWSFSLSISLSNEYSELISLELSGLISLHPRDSQESSPASQFKNINFSEGLLNTNYSQGKQKEIMK